MKIMASAMLILFSIKPEFAPLIGCRMTQRSAECGWSSYSAFGLYSFGQALVSLTKDIDEGFFWVKAGLALLKQESGIGQLPILNTMYHAFISYWKEPLHASREALIDTHQEALLEGQMEFSMTSSLHSCRQGFMCGVNLGKLNADCTSVSNKMVSVQCC